MLYKVIKSVVVNIPVYLFRYFFSSTSFSSSKKDRLEFDSFVGNKLLNQEKNKLALPSISAVIRVKNGAEYIESSILSIVPLVSEIIVIDNGSSDNTLDIVSRLKKDLEGKLTLSIYNYNKKIEVAGKGYRERLSRNKTGSLATFYNYCFSLANADYVLKWDAHGIMFPKGIDSIQSKLHKNADIIYLRGLEIHGKKLSHEIRLYKSKLDLKYIDDEEYERLDVELSELSQSTIPTPVYLHIKRLSYCKFDSKNPIFSKYKSS